MHVLTVNEVIAMAWTTTSAAILITIGRFFIHYQRRKRICWDDIFNAVAVAFLLGYAGTWQADGPRQYQAQLFGLGYTDKEPPEGNIKIAMQYSAANSILFWCVIYAVKASFLALYWHVFHLSKKFRIFWWIAMVYTLISFLVTFLWGFWICGNVKHFMDIKICALTPPEVGNRMLIAWCVLDVLGDLMLMGLPIAMLKRLRICTYQKLELAVLFGLVVINIAFEILRTLYTLWLDLARFPDQNLMWCFLQVTTAVIVCALPCYGGLLTRKKRPYNMTLSYYDTGTRETEMTHDSEGSSWRSASGAMKDGGTIIIQHP